jgi:flavin-dependent dehydrogenase
MDRCDVLVVGGGPAGSSCAWGLRRAGLDVVVVDRRRFPRDKVCAGWVTPQAFAALELSPGAYADGHTCQPFSGFRVGAMGRRLACADHEEPVSYGVRRCEFDDFLLQRSGARLRLGEATRSLAREGDAWVWNGELRAPMLVGAGGHFCPVARIVAGDGAGDPIVAAQEIEFRLDARAAAACPVVPELPELFFAPDLRGYGWVVRKGDFINLGFGRQDASEFPRHLRAFLGFLAEERKLPDGTPHNLHGHAYRLYGQPPRPLVADRVLLVGDAAGLAEPHSGEGIRPAIESGLLAAEAIAAADGQYGRAALVDYAHALGRRLGAPAGALASMSEWLPEAPKRALGGWLLGQDWFARRIVVDGWFLRRGQPPLGSARKLLPKQRGELERRTDNGRREVRPSELRM